MAPEQAEASREAITTAVDVHALGAILYELLAGRPAFRAGTVLETLRLVREEEPARPRLVNSQIDRDLETIVLRCLEKAPSRRYASAAALADDLDRWLAGVPIHARPASVPERLVKWARRKPTFAALLLVGIVAVSASALAIGGLVAWNRENSRRRQAEELFDRSAQDRRQLEGDLLFRPDPRGGTGPRSPRRRQGRTSAGRMPAALAELGVAAPDAALHPEVRVIQGHTAFVCASDFAPDTSILRCRDDVLPGSIWDVSADAPLYHRTLTAASGSRRIRGLDGTAYGLTFDRAGICLATADPEGIVKVWNVVTGKMTHLVRAHRGWAYGVAFSPDGARLATAGEDGMVRIWDIGPASGDSGRALQALAGHDGPVFGIAFSPDGGRVASAGSDGTVRIWEPARTGSETVSVLRGHKGEVIGVAFRPDGKQLASGGADRNVRIWDASTGRELTSFSAATHRINALAYNPAGTRLAVGSHDRSVAIWDAATYQCLIDYPGHSAPVLYVGFSPGGKVLASASQDATIKVWDPIRRLECSSCASSRPSRGKRSRPIVGPRSPRGGWAGWRSPRRETSSRPRARRKPLRPGTAMAE